MYYKVIVKGSMVRLEYCEVFNTYSEAVDFYHYALKDNTGVYVELRECLISDNGRELSAIIRSEYK